MVHVASWWLFALYPILFICAGDLYSLISKLLGQSKDIDHIHKYRSNTDLMAHSDSVIQKKDLGSPNAKVVFHPSLMRDRIHKFHQLEATAEPPRSKLLAEGQGGSWILFHCQWCWNSPLLLPSLLFLSCMVHFYCAIKTLMNMSLNEKKNLLPV